MSKYLSIIHITLLALAILLGYTLYQWYTILADFTVQDFRSGSSVVTYDDVVVAGGEIKFTRKITSEPPGCRVVVYRYLIPIVDMNQELFIGSFERMSKPSGQIEYRTVQIPASIPAGSYIYQARANYYCTWLNDVFGPIKGRSVPVYIEVVEPGTVIEPK